MNIFEDLIGELKEEELLEETVIDAGARTRGNSRVTDVKRVAASREGAAPAAEPEVADALEIPKIGSGEDEVDYYRKRAMEEVSSLQMVENIFSGIERRYLKTVPSPYDDLEAKKALHRFLKVSGDIRSVDYAEAEYALLQETETWSTVLSERDENFSVGKLRRYCETSQPPLSSQALVALSRFYRNSKFSENARSKYDFVITRLFSRDGEDQRRRLLFEPAEMTGHLRTLYANWGGIPQYSSKDLPNAIDSAVARLNALISEAEAADEFDRLLESKFFDRLNQYKASIGELFFAPEVTSKAIECNIRVGNIFVELVEIERRRMTAEAVEERYGYTYDQIISHAAGKTLNLIDLFRLDGDIDAEGDPSAGARSSADPAVQSHRRAGPAPPAKLGINRWLLALALVSCITAAGVFYWVQSPTENPETLSAARTVEITDTELTEYVRAGRATETTLYVMTLPAWDSLPAEKKKESIKKVFEMAAKMQLRRVQFINQKGRNVGYATAEQVELQQGN